MRSNYIIPEIMLADHRANPSSNLNFLSAFTMAQQAIGWADWASIRNQMRVVHCWDERAVLAYLYDAGLLRFLDALALRSFLGLQPEPFERDLQDAVQAVGGADWGRVEDRLVTLYRYSQSQVRDFFCTEGVRSFNDFLVFA